MFLLCTAGDHIKFNYPMAYSTVVLTWGLLEFKDAYEASGQLQWMYDSIKWPLDYLLKCHVADDELYVQVNTSLYYDNITGLERYIYILSEPKCKNRNRKERTECSAHYYWV